MQWSPDGQHLALATGRGLLLVLDPTFGVAAELALLEDTPARPLGPDNITLTWRGDGRLLGSVIRPHSGPLVLRVMDRDTLQFTARGEELESPTATASWQPNGRHLYVAGSGRVVLFEANGLQHGGFDLPPTSCEGRAISGLSWSQDSECLAVVLGPASPGPLASLVQLWVRSNWHWYLQGEAEYPPEEGPVLARQVYRQELQPGAVTCVLNSHPRRWDEERPMCLTVVSSAGLHHAREFVRDSTASSLGTCAVVDGAGVRVSALGLGLVPPPMAHVRLITPSGRPVVSTALRESPEEGCLPECLACCDAAGGISLMEAVERDLWEEVAEDWAKDSHSSAAAPVSQQQQQKHRGGPAGGSYEGAPRVPLVPVSLDRITTSPARQVAWAGDASLLVVVAGEEGESDRLLEIEVSITQRTSSGLPSAATGTIAWTGRLQDKEAGVLRLLTGQMGALVEDSKGRVFRFLPGGQLETAGPMADLPTPCRVLRPAPAVEGLPAGPLGISPRGQLFWGGALLATSATSAGVRLGGAGGPHLCFTTRDNLLRTLPLSAVAQLVRQGDRALPALEQDRAAVKAAGPADTSDQSWRVVMKLAMRPDAATLGARDIATRALEQGAVLVAAPAGGVQLVVQLPRGNLEGISPRALVVPSVLAALDSGRYADAWEEATSHRLDLNLLADYRWPRLVEQAVDFVRQIRNEADLIDFMGGLAPGDVTADGAIYGELPAVRLGAMAGTASRSMAGKVGAVCAALRGAMETLDAPGFALGILSSFVRSDPPLLAEALLRVKALKEAGMSPEGLPRPKGVSGRASCPSAEDCLRHLLVYVDADSLYRAALGVYDLPLAYMVVASAQRDPAECLEELKGFAAVQPEQYRRVRIDLHLARHERAIRGLAELCGSSDTYFPELLSIATNRGLLREALELFDPQRHVSRRPPSSPVPACVKQPGLFFLAGSGAPCPAVGPRCAARVQAPV